MREGQRVVLGVERDLIPFIGEGRGEGELFGRERVAVLFASVRIGTEVVVVVLALKILVYPNHLVNIIANIRLDHLGGDRAVIGNGDGLPDIVHERGEDHLVIGPGPLGERRGLKAMCQLVGVESIGDLGEGFEEHQHAVGDTTLIDRVLRADVEPLLLGGLIHSGERGSHRPILP